MKIVRPVRYNNFKNFFSFVLIRKLAGEPGFAGLLSNPPSTLSNLVCHKIKYLQGKGGGGDGDGDKVTEILIP